MNVNVTPWRNFSLVSLTLLTRKPTLDFGTRGPGAAPAVPNHEIMVGSQRTGCSNSHRFSSLSYSEIRLLAPPVSRFTVNKKVLTGVLVNGVSPPSGATAVTAPVCPVFRVVVAGRYLVCRFN